MQYNCECIKGSLMFDQNSIRCACSNNERGILYQHFNGKNIDFDKIEKIRKSCIDSFIAGNPPDVCKKCYMLYEDTSGDIEKPYTKELDYLYIFHWYHCNCACIYCCNMWATHGKITAKAKKSEYYDLLPTIKLLCENGYIGKNTQVMPLGGEITVLKEFSKIVKLLSEYTEKGFIFLSSGIAFSNTIYSELKKPDAQIHISLDSGTPEMYKKIKKTDSFYDVINNVKRYLKANPDSVTLKYIMINKLNDNKEELTKFVEIAKSIGIKKICLDLDHNRNRNNRIKPVPDHYYEIFQWFVDQKGINGVITSQCQRILEEKQVF